MQRPKVAQSNRRGVEAEARIARIVAVATRFFSRRGYARTSLNDITAQAGGSKATVVKYFGGKAGLFATVVAEVSQRFVAEQHLAELEGTPAQVMQQWGETVLGFYLANSSLATYRDVIAEGNHYPAMARGFYERGHERLRSGLAAQLARWCDEGLLAMENCTDRADMFLHMMRAGPYEQRLLGLRTKVSRQEVTLRVSSAVDLFLRGCSL
jgi:AcrR family transcriptional regulator